MTRRTFIDRTNTAWRTSPRWQGIERPYSAEDVYRLRGSFNIEHSVAKLGAERLWELLHTEDYIHSLSAVTGNQAIQHVRAGLKAIYVSGWQTAADANTASAVYPDLSLYPCDSVPELVSRINNALLRADQIHHYKENKTNGHGTYWLAPIVADAEAGFGGVLHAYEIMQHMVRAGAAGVHFEDQLASVKKCGHLGGKVIVPTQEFITKLVSARLAADVMGVDSLIIARTDAGSAGLLTSDVDPYDHEFLLGERTHEGFYRVKAGLEQAISRGLAYAPYADLIWFETSLPDLDEAQAFADAIHERFPGKLLAYNCSPSFNWKANLDENTSGVPEPARQHGLPLSIRDAVGIPLAQLRDVPARAGLSRARDGGVLGVAAGGVRGRKGGLRSGSPPGVRGHGILRRDQRDRDQRDDVDAWYGGLDRGAAVLGALGCGVG